MSAFRIHNDQEITVEEYNRLEKVLSNTNQLQISIIKKNFNDFRDILKNFDINNDEILKISVKWLNPDNDPLDSIGNVFKYYKGSKSIIEFAVEHFELEIVEYLIKNGCDTSVIIPDIDIMMSKESFYNERFLNSLKDGRKYLIEKYNL